MFSIGMLSMGTQQLRRAGCRQLIAQLARMMALAAEPLLTYGFFSRAVHLFYREGQLRRCEVWAFPVISE